MWMHISRLFSKFKVFIQLVEKKMCYRKKRLNLKICPFISKLDFFCACCIFFSSDNAIAIYLCRISKYNLMILLRVNAYNNTLNVKYHNSIKK